MKKLHPRLIGLLAAVALLASPCVLAQQTIRLSTTTSTENSGLLAYLLPIFEAKTGTKVQVIAVGTGKALELAKNGDVDVTLVHARQAEDKFVAEAHGVDRRDVMYNDFLVVCPPSDPAGIRGSKDVIGAFRQLAAGKTRFISRGDNSGTDAMEQSYWKAAGIKPEAARYLSAGLGMGEVLTRAAELQACTLTDRATFIAYKARTGLAIMVEGDKRMFNPYGIILVNPARHPGIHEKGARLLAEWITSAEGQGWIARFRVDGQQVFFPSATRP
jgi:tungstate transport system substrate-binding protein